MQRPEDIPPGSPPPREVYTVSRLNLEVRGVLEGHFPPLWVEGEISNLVRPRSGHLYFSLKDQRCQVRCAMFRTRNRALGFRPADGMQVLAHGRVGLYPERGDFQLVVEYLEEAGAGALRRAFEALKRRLAAEGLFDEALRKPLPLVPARLGVITSPTGAAIRDILSVLARRFPALPVVIYPVPVQGAGAAEAIARAIALADRRGECEVLILARGGGSLEDLWAFNEEVVARAIHACSIPVVTGIGHEIDFTIADFAADRRAPTPSAAAELVAPEQAELRQRFTTLESRARRQLLGTLREARQTLAWLQQRLEGPRRRLLDAAQRVDGLSLRLTRAARGLTQARRARLAELGARLRGCDPVVAVRAGRARREQLERRLRAATGQSLTAGRARLDALRRTLLAVSPQHTLERGYAIVSREPGREVLRTAASVRPGERVSARLARGELRCRVEDAREGEPQP